MTLPGSVPDVAAVRAWIDVPASEISDEQLAQVLEAELAIQVAYCDWAGEEYPASLAQALLRRCARAVAARGLPLGTLPPAMTGTGMEFGAAILPRLDAEVERYEAPFRITAIA